MTNTKKDKQRQNKKEITEIVIQKDRTDKVKMILDIIAMFMSAGSLAIAIIAIIMSAALNGKTINIESYGTYLDYDIYWQDANIDTKPALEKGSDGNNVIKNLHFGIFANRGGINRITVVACYKENYYAIETLDLTNDIDLDEQQLAAINPKISFIIE